jgi:hypothetical protein
MGWRLLERDTPALDQRIGHGVYAGEWDHFTKDGIIDFDVQYWTGHVWKNVPGGAIRGNKNVWRKITFPTLTTNKIRVFVRKASGSYSKIVEVEAFHVNEAPVVKLKRPSSGTARSWLEFDRNASDNDRAIAKYTFNFGDGTPDFELEYSDNPAIKEIHLKHMHMYLKPGTYTVTVRVRDHDDEGSESSLSVTVADPDARRP